MIVVSDAGPLIHLSLVSSLGLLSEIYGRILIPDLVYDEVVKRGEGLAGSTEVAEAGWIGVASSSPESDLFRLLRTHLDSGETAAIASPWSGVRSGSPKRHPSHMGWLGAKKRRATSVTRR